MKRTTPTKRASTSRGGVTLVELLVTISILAILGSAIMFAMVQATEAARRAKTRTMIATLHTLLMERYESYRTRRVPIPTSSDPGAAAQDRLRAIRAIMKMEMPDRWTDITELDVFVTDNGIDRPALSRAYERRHNQLSPPPKTQYQGAECLYMIITMATGEGEARSHFADSSIGDVDNDGAPEFLDGWGKPISFIRWPAGFISELQPLVGGGTDPITDRDPDNDHDPFDPLKVHSVMYPAPDAFRLVPLIYSAGADGVFDISTSKDDETGINPYERPGVPPNLLLPMLGTQRDGNDEGEQWHDNIHNHLIGLR